MKESPVCECGSKEIRVMVPLREVREYVFAEEGTVETNRHAVNGAFNEDLDCECLDCGRLWITGWDDFAVPSP